VFRVKEETATKVARSLELTPLRDGARAAHGPPHGQPRGVRRLPQGAGDLEAGRPRGDATRGGVSRRWRSIPGSPWPGRGSLARSTKFAFGVRSSKLDLLEPLLKVPYRLTPGWLQIDPNFDPLRGNPRFEK
jgi:hypothetical protein